MNRVVENDSYQLPISYLVAIIELAVFSRERGQPVICTPPTSGIY